MLQLAFGGKIYTCMQQATLVTQLQACCQQYRCADSYSPKTTRHCIASGAASPQKPVQFGEIEDSGTAGACAVGAAHSRAEPQLAAAFSQHNNGIFITALM